MVKYLFVGFIFISLLLTGSSGPSETTNKTATTETTNLIDTTNPSYPHLTEGTPMQDVDNSQVVLPKTRTEAISLYGVVKVVDGDTIDVMMDGKVERLRLIGINTPETVDPRKPVECFGREASNRAKELLDGKIVSLESDPSQGERDKYGRLLRYVFLENGDNFNLRMIEEGYAYEYTYDGSYKYQNEFKFAQEKAETNKSGLWGAGCEDTSTTAPEQPATTNSCDIKGNINAKKEKIFHSPGCGSYNNTVIDESAGEKWFCSEQDALNTGWRKALNC